MQDGTATGMPGQGGDDSCLPERGRFTLEVWAKKFGMSERALRESLKRRKIPVYQITGHVMAADAEDMYPPKRAISTKQAGRKGRPAA